MSKSKKTFKPSNVPKKTMLASPNPKEKAAMTDLFVKGSLIELEALLRTWTIRFPKYILGWQALVALLQQQGKTVETLAPLQKLTELLPNDAEAHLNLGNALLELEQPDRAVLSYRRALELRQDYTEAYSNLGNALSELGQLDSAVLSYQRALEFEPNFAEVCANLGVIFQRQGQLADAESCLRRSLAIKPDFIEAKITFAACVKHLHFTKDDSGEVRTAVLQALSHAWGRPSDLAEISVNLVKLDKDIAETITKAACAWPKRLSAHELFCPASLNTVAADLLLRTLLISTPNCDIELERFLTMVRKTMLDAALKTTAFDFEDPIALNFYGALAQQCFVNEYVFAWTDDEASQAHSLRESVIASLETGAPVPAIWLVTVAAYFPLYSMPSINQLLNKRWPETVNAILKQQVLEPDEERQYRASLTHLTPIKNEVSLLVQNQYEENPYPRWIKATLVAKPLSINKYFRKYFPQYPFRPLDNDSYPNILIAGCGTGLQSIITAQTFLNARVLAVDLSKTSLCYAKRKTRELGISAIEFAQADILNLGTLDRNFDIIESVGVLHHLDNPWAGWRVLLSLLRSGGLMRLGFYSKAARRDITRARSFITEQGYGLTNEGIRRCRQDIMDLDENTGISTVVTSTDFFSLSECRDHLFHVQEHLMTLTDIEMFLQDNNLQFLGFDISPLSLQAYRLRFPDDPAATNLAHWQSFENDNPTIFRGMYQFWVQKTN